MPRRPESLFEQARACNTLAIRYIYRMGKPAIETLPGDVHDTRIKHLTFIEVRDVCLPSPGLRLSCAPNTKDKTYHNSVMHSYKRFNCRHVRANTLARTGFAV